MHHELTVLSGRHFAVLLRDISVDSRIATRTASECNCRAAISHCQNRCICGELLANRLTEPMYSVNCSDLHRTNGRYCNFYTAEVPDHGARVL